MPRNSEFTITVTHQGGDPFKEIALEWSCRTTSTGMPWCKKFSFIHSLKMAISWLNFFFPICADFEKRGVPTGINCGIDMEQLRGSPSITIDTAALTESNYTFTVTATQMGKGHFIIMLMITNSSMTPFHLQVCVHRSQQQLLLSLRRYLRFLLITNQGINNIMNFVLNTRSAGTNLCFIWRVNVHEQVFLKGYAIASNATATFIYKWKAIRAHPGSILLDCFLSLLEDSFSTLVTRI